jgi:hypothetical protein
MSNSRISRRDFLKLCGLGLTSLAFRPYFQFGEELDNPNLARITTTSVSVHSQPNDESRILYQRFRDDLLSIYEEVISPDGPGYNPKWYRVWGGYVHSAHVLRTTPRLNPVLSSLTGSRQLGEITVPFTQSMRKVGKGWEPVYRLYDHSCHWIVGIETGPDGQIWYALKDELLEVDYYIPAEHMRPIPYSEWSPISTDVDRFKKRIDVSLTMQTATAFENDKQVFSAKISSGIPQLYAIPGKIPTATPTGQFRVQSKMASKHMGDGNLTADPEAYEIPGVPWAAFFEPVTGVAFHGVYWHDNYGTPMSHGCVNMRPKDALWIFRWTTPDAPPDKEEQVGWGTLVNVFY